MIVEAAMESSPRSIPSDGTPGGTCVTAIGSFQTSIICPVRTGLSVEESVRMTEDRDKCRKYVHGVALGSKTAKEQNRSAVAN